MNVPGEFHVRLFHVKHFSEILGEPLNGRKSDHPEALLANTESRKYLPKQIVSPKFASNRR